MTLGYLFIAFAMVGGTAKAYCGKRTSGLICTTTDAVYMNTVRMAICVLVGFAIALLQTGSLASFALPTVGMAISILSGMCQAGFVLFWLLSVKTGAYVMVEVFILLGTILPIVICHICFDETTRLLQWVGYLVLLCAVFLLCSYNNTIKARLGAKSYALLFAAGITNGLSDLSQKLFTRLQPTESKAVYNFYTFLVAAVVLGSVLLLRSLHGHGNGAENTVARKRKMYLYIGVMAAGLFVYNYFKTCAAEIVPAAKMYPLMQGISLVITIVMAALLFGERIKWKSASGIALTFAALCMMNL